MTLLIIFCLLILYNFIKGTFQLETVTKTSFIIIPIYALVMTIISIFTEQQEWHLLVTIVLILIGINSTSFSFDFGNIILLMPYLSAARTFSLTPPIGKTLPLNVISPVIAISYLTFLPDKAEYRDVAIDIPAEGPSFGTAPSGK